LIVDDGSTDSTPEILRELSSVSGLRVLTHKTNQGLGAAIKTGFAEARGDVIVTMDADLSHSMGIVSKMITGCETADAVYASRYVPGGGMVGIPLWRKIISRTANLILRLVYMSPVHDLTTGYRAYRTEAVRNLEVTSSGFEAQLEISIRLLAAGRTIREIPLVLTNREAGESKMRYLSLIPKYGAVALRMIAVRWFGRSLSMGGV
jgi:dolichol-phosphate mannosyltransferase